MPVEENKSLVRRYYDEMWNRWNLSLADDLIGEGLAFRGSLGVSVQGREAFKDYMRAVHQAFPDFHNRIEELVAEDDKVVARLTYTGTHRGELFGIGPTGERLTAFPGADGSALRRWEESVAIVARPFGGARSEEACHKGSPSKCNQLLDRAQLQPRFRR